MFVPNKYDVSEDPPRLKAIRQARLGVARPGRLIQKDNSGSSAGLKTPRYRKRLHEKVFIAILKSPLFNGVVPSKKTDLGVLASMLEVDTAKILPCKNDTLKLVFKGLSKSCAQLSSNVVNIFG